MLRFALFFTICLMVPLPSMATASNPPSPTSYLSVITSLFLVIGVMLVLAILYKRMNLGFTGSHAIKVITALPIGTKERIMVIEVNGQQHLIGVTPQQINHLISLDEPIDSGNNGVSAEQGDRSFQQILQQAITGVNNKGSMKRANKKGDKAS